MPRVPASSTPPPPFSAVVLAGGQSRRMGRDKAWLPWRGRPLIARQVELLRSLGPAEVFISGRVGVDYRALGCPVLLDRQAGSGPLAGIEVALATMRSPLLCVLAVDLPRMTAGFVRALSRRTAGGVGVIPRLGGRVEPLVAFYPQAARELAERQLERGLRAVSGFAAACVDQGLARSVAVRAADAVRFTNWNRLEDLASGVEKRDRLPDEHSTC